MIGRGMFCVVVSGILAGVIALQEVTRDHGLINNMIVGVIGALRGSIAAELLGTGSGGV